MTDQITGYHFTGATLRNGEPIPKLGEWLVHNGLSYEDSRCPCGDKKLPAGPIPLPNEPYNH